MTHDEFVERLASEGALDDAARAHARSCSPCNELSEALDRIAREESVQFDPPPDSYWASFDERLRARLPRSRPAARPAWAWAAAASLLVACAAGLVFWRSVAPGGVDPPRSAAALLEHDADEVLAAAEDLSAGLDASATAWEGPEERDLREILPAQGAWTALPWEDPLGLVGDELAALGAEEQRELAERLMEESRS